MKRLDKSGQVWVETVIYTLIGLAIIGLVLAVAKPKIEEKKDSIIIEQAMESLGNINDKITAVINSGEGNRRSLELKITKGKLIINMDEDTVSWILESSFEYSEEDTTIRVGSINVTTTRGDPWEVELKSGYGIDLSYNGETTGSKEVDSAPTPYNLVIENNGTTLTGNLQIDLREA